MIWVEINQNFGEQTNMLLPFLITIFLVLLILIIFSYHKYGTKKTIMYFLPMTIIALFIESAGVASGRYYYPGYIIYISVVGGGVPLLIALAWSANLFLFFNLGKHIVLRLYEKRNFLQIFLISFIAGFTGLCLDLLEDPLAHHNNWWIWEESLIGIRFFEVPILNFIGWFVLIFFMSMSILLIERSKFSENRKVLISITSIAITGFVILVVHGIISRILQAFGLA